jgi:hypothetical protein
MTADRHAEIAQRRELADLELRQALACRKSMAPRKLGAGGHR